MSKQTITAMFDTRAHADQAAAQLRQAGVPASDVVVSPENARDELGVRASDMSTNAAPKKTGFWASLEDMFGGTEDHDTYIEGLRRGGTLLTAHVEDGHIDRAVDILEQHGSVDLDERETSWRSEGWSGGSTGAALAATGVAGAGTTGLAMAGTVPATKVVTAEARVATPVATAPVATAPIAAKAAPVQTAARAGTDEVLQVVEERLDVGKRAVSRGKVRLHSYVVEKNVSENVSLHDETVTIDRRPVDRAIGALGADAFVERTIEAEETGEEAVVSKSARVVEEIGVRKDAVERTETVRDSVRSTKVEVEDARTVGTTAKVGATGDFGARLAKDMEVVGSDGQHLGVIDHVEGDTIKLKRNDPASGGQHHLIAVTSVASVGAKVTLKMTTKDAKARWTVAN